MMRQHDRWLFLLAVGGGTFIATQSLTVCLLAGGLLLLGVAAFFSPIAVLNILLVLSPLRTLIATEAGLALPIDIGQILLILFWGTWVAWRILLKQPLFRWKMSPVIILITLYLLVSGITAFAAISISSWVTEWLKWLIILSLIIILLHEASEHWRYVVFGLMVAGSANALVGLYIFFGGSGADHLLINGRFFRAFGTFGQPNPFGGFMGLLIPLAGAMTLGYASQLFHRWRLGKMLSGKDAIWMLFFGLASMILLGGLIASWSRGAWLGFIVSSAGVAFALPRRIWQSILLSSAMLSIVMGAWYFDLIPDAIKVRVLSSATELFQISDVRGVDITTANYAIVERLAHWQAAQNMARDNIWFGVGLGNYEIAYEQYRLINWDEPLGHAHNYYLNILAEAGMIGLIMYSAMWIGILWITWKARSHPDRIARSAVIGLFGTWIYLSIHSLLDNLYVNNLFIHIGVLLGILAILYHQTYQRYQWG